MDPFHREKQKRTKKIENKSELATTPTTASSPVHYVWTLLNWVNRWRLKNLKGSLAMFEGSLRQQLN